MPFLDNTLPEYRRIRQLPVAPRTVKLLAAPDLPLLILVGTCFMPQSALRNIRQAHSWHRRRRRYGISSGPRGLVHCDGMTRQLKRPHPVTRSLQHARMHRRRSPFASPALPTTCNLRCGASVSRSSILWLVQSTRHSRGRQPPPRTDPTLRLVRRGHRHYYHSLQAAPVRRRRSNPRQWTMALLPLAVWHGLWTPPSR